jgi:hypothetical protein
MQNLIGVDSKQRNSPIFKAAKMSRFTVDLEVLDVSRTDMMHLYSQFTFKVSPSPIFRGGHLMAAWPIKVLVFVYKFCL